MRALFFVMIFVCNALMWFFLSKAYQCGTTVHVLLINNAANLYLTVLLVK